MGDGDEIDWDRRQEYADEERRQPLYDFIDDYKRDLVRGFIDDNKELYEEFRKLYAEDVAEDTAFIESEEQLWIDYCEEEYSNHQDEQATRNSINNWIYSGHR